MSKIKLEAKKRDLSVKAKDLLKESRLPGVVYGPKSESISVDMDYQEFRKTFLQVKK
jgi:ribosomal protein L25 (general stress protein Ctc)